MISRHTSSVPREDGVLSRLLYCDSRCFQTCRSCFQACPQHSQVFPDWSSVLPGLSPALPGAPRCTQSSLQCSEVFPNVSQSLTWSSCTSHQRSQLLSKTASVPSQGLILSWNSHIEVYTPHPLRHSWRLPVTKIHFADVYTMFAYITFWFAHPIYPPSLHNYHYQVY